MVIKKLPKTAALNKHLTQWKKKEDRLWLTDAFAVCLQQRQRDLREASLEAWAESKRGFPVWRTGRKAHHSTMRFVQFPKYCQILDRHIKRPNGLKLVRFRKSQDIQGTPRNCTVALDACGQWYISIMCEVDVGEQRPAATTAAGIDMGIAKNMTLSNGVVFSGVHSFKAIMGQLAKEQRKFARMVKGSANWQKQQLRSAIITQ